MGITVKQGDIFLVNLNPVKGHKQAGFRPVLIVQNDILNENLNTTIAAPITKNLSNKGRLTTCFLTKKSSGLLQDSLALLFQIRVLDQTRLLRKIGNINSLDWKNIRDQISYLF